MTISNKVDYSLSKGPKRSAEWLWWMTALLGVLGFTVIVFGTFLFKTPLNFGWSLYDEAFLAYQAGTLDLPARALRYEGHFTPEGLGYLYQGLAPLLTRYVLAPFIDVANQPLGPFSIWFWACVGTLSYHRAFYLVLQQAVPAHAVLPASQQLLLAAAIWFGAPGLLLIANLSLYHEPSVLAYAMFGLALMIYVRSVVSGLPLRWGLVVIAALSAVALHARPNIAVGMYLFVLILVVPVIVRFNRIAVWPALLSIVLLGAGGFSYLGWNELRFDEVGAGHGTFSSGPLQYGTTYWIFEYPDSPRAAAFEQHGRFNIHRIVPNAAFYLFEPPAALTESGSSLATALHRTVTADRLGYIRVEGPGGGVIGLWLPWALLAALGLFALRSQLLFWHAPLAGALCIAVLTAAYGTITLRYHFDLWPLIAVLALLGSTRWSPWLMNHSRQGRWLVLSGLIVGFGLIMNAITAIDYSTRWNEWPGSSSAIWTYDYCAERARTHSLTDEQIAYSCRAPQVLYTTP